MVDRDFLAPGTELSIQHGDHGLTATVVMLPFVAP
jgi:hypothetical protein